MSTESNVRSFVRVFMGPVNDFEAAAQAVLTGRGLDTTFSFILDLIGKIVGEPRRGHADALYVRYLRARIAANRSDGTGEDLITVAKAILGDDPVTLDIEPSQVCSVYVRLQGAATDPDVAAAVLSLLKTAKLGGVRIIVQYLTQDPANVFTFAKSAHATAPLSAGDTTIPVDSTAGFPATGTLVVEKGTTVEESVTYTVFSATSFALGSALSNNHDQRASCTIQNLAQAFNHGHLSAAIQ